jgi:hypothetical protein
MTPIATALSPDDIADVAALPRGHPCLLINLRD